MAITKDEQYIQQKVGEKIRELRLAANMRATELAQQSGLSQSQISKLETGKASITIKGLSRICDVLNRPLSYLFQSEEELPRVLGTLNTVAGPERQGMLRFVEDVHRRTNRRVSLIPLLASQLLQGGDQVEQLREGVIDLFIEGLKYFYNIFPGLDVLSLPYCFINRAHMVHFLESSYFSNIVKGQFLEKGIRILNEQWNWWRGLEWVLLSKKPIISPDQIKGLRVRAEEIPLSKKFWEAMGAQPVTVPWADVKMALRLNHIDVLPTWKSHIYPMGFSRFARYITKLGDVSPQLTVTINETKYQALTPFVQKALRESSLRMGPAFSEHIESAEKNNEEKNLKEFGAAYLQVDHFPWHEAVRCAQQILYEKGSLRIDLWNAIEQARPSSLDQSNESFTKNQYSG